MHRPVRALLIGLLLSASCNEVGNELEDPDGRPLELTYITATVFAPSCGQAQCHSKFHQASGLVLDNPDDVRSSLHRPGDNLFLLEFDSDKDDFQWQGPSDTVNYPPALITWVTEIDPFSAGIGRMPFDAPLANRDIELLSAWIRDGQPQARGAQCDPRRDDAKACNGNDVYTCTPEGNFGELVAQCSTCRYPESAANPGTYFLDCE